MEVFLSTSDAEKRVDAFTTRCEASYLISGGPEFPGDAIAVKELIGALAEMQESHQFWHAGLGDGVIGCSLWITRNSFGVASTTSTAR